jgi:hypothetical protein
MISRTISRGLVYSRTSSIEMPIVKGIITKDIVRVNRMMGFTR